MARNIFALGCFCDIFRRFSEVECTPVPRKGLPEADIEDFDKLEEVDKQAIRDHLSGPKKTKRKSTATASKHWNFLPGFCVCGPVCFFFMHIKR